MRNAATPLMILIALLPAACGCARDPVETISAADPSAAADLPPIEVSAGDWPWWRGPERNNHAAGPLPPLSWSEKENVLWKTEVPGRGHATPTIWGDAIFVATADEAKKTQLLLCYDRETGRPRWSTPIHQGALMHAHSKNSQASATPACDGERIFTAFIHDGAVWVTAVNLEGEIVWQKQAGPFSSQHGYGSAPAIYQSLVIVSGDNQGPGFVAALHRETGEIVWRTARENDPSYGTPVIAHTGGREQLLLHGQNRTESYDPATGRELWSAPGPADVTANTPAWNETRVFVGGGYPQSAILAIDANNGEISWRSEQKSYVPSPLVVGDRLFVVQDNGVARCFDAASGEELWKRRLGGDFSASPAVCEGHVFVPSEDGVLHIFKAADQYEEIARNELADGGGFASPVICGGRLYLRTSRHLYCIGGNAAAE